MYPHLFLSGFNLQIGWPGQSSHNSSVVRRTPLRSCSALQALSTLKQLRVFNAAWPVGETMLINHQAEAASAACVRCGSAACVLQCVYAPVCICRLGCTCMHTHSCVRTRWTLQASGQLWRLPALSSPDAAIHHHACRQVAFLDLMLSTKAPPSMLAPRARTSQQTVRCLMPSST